MVCRVQKLSERRLCRAPICILWLLAACTGCTPQPDTVGADDPAGQSQTARIAELIEQMDMPSDLPFKALNDLIAIGEPAVPALIEAMKTSRNWQYPKALGAIGDERAVGPLIEELNDTPPPPMRNVVAEALTAITGKTFGTEADAWRHWWQSEGGVQAE